MIGFCDRLYSTQRFDELCALVQAVRILESRQETDRDYISFSDSEAVFRRIRSGERGPGQRYAI